jgi:hypothetical protein
MSGIWNLDGGGRAYGEAEAERQAAFDKIKPADNWKMPVDAWIDVADFEQCNRACIHFTGSTLDIIDRSGGRVRVVADGYYIAIGA